MIPLSRRHDFVLIFDVTNGNPNGDPDAGNLPRLDPETNHGLVSDVSLKRKLRNYVELARTGEAGHHIYVQEGAILNEKHREAYVAKRADDAKALKEAKEAKKLNPKGDDEARALRDWMCANFFDVRTFGAVMSTGINCGQVKGPVQMTFARSVEPILPVEISITRMAATNEAEQKKRAEGEEGEARTDNRTMGRKHIVPYGLYVAHGFISAKFAERTGFSEADLDLLFEALANMFEHDRSAARGEMTTRKLIVFAHENALGNAPAHVLFDRVRIGRAVDGEFRDLDDRGLGNLAPARKFADYRVEIDRDGLPAGVEIRELL
ncbi:CRISPR-associated Csd2 family protein [Rhodobacter viridis]|uniref:CRISPR-associated Csd2 family protein n=1 Tax=Rhodobacter viridis TaxID=1054202 RepID=A0A318U0C3_9RHOB|nr:type I-C CRISPR-associated protein Cas7/Csd2 [Rhodobacter viridis]PYF09571.1 CRISPR-associated Csd2 family protein [Rhodobacter viridis]